MGQILLLVLGVQVGEEDHVRAEHEVVDHPHATALAAAGPAPPRLAKPARTGDQRMALGLRGDRFLQFLLHRRPQQPGGGPFIAAAPDDASHRTILRLCRMERQGKRGAGPSSGTAQSRQERAVQHPHQ